jgi:hypothetical protein
MDELTQLALTVAVIIGILTWSIRAGAVAGVLFYVGFIALVLWR